MRYGRLGIGLIVVLAALWVIIGEQITSVSSDAVVNARLTTLRTPIAGIVEMSISPFGTKFTKGEAIATVTDPLVDTIRLNELLFELAQVKSQTSKIQLDIANTTLQISGLTVRSTAYRERRREEINLRLFRARERVALLSPGVEVTNDALVGEASVPADSTELSLASQELEVLKVEKAALEQGVYLGDGYNDASATEIKLVDLTTSLHQLKSLSSSLQIRAEDYEVRIGLERRRTGLLSATAISAPIEGVLWEVLASDGEAVQRGQEIVRLMNCGSALVTLSVPDAVYNKLRVGQNAKFRLNSTDEIFDGTITRIAGAGAETIYQNLAIAPSIKHLERYDVSLLVPALRENTQLRCVVGQTGRVFFDSRPLDWLRGFLR